MKNSAISGLMAGCLCFAAGTAAAKNSMLVYVGTYTGKDSKGIYCFRMDTDSGELGPLELVAEAANPSFLSLHPNGRFLYAVAESGKKGAVNAFEIERESGKLKFLNKEETGGSGPCHISLDRAGKASIVSEYGSGTVSVLPILGDGRVGKMSCFIQHQGKGADAKRQEKPHAHSTNLDPAERFAFVADLGMDKMMIYRYDATAAKLSPNDPAFASLHPGAGPRHFCFAPSVRFAYVINELDSTITAFSYDSSKGALSEIQTLSALPDGFGGKSFTAEVQMHPSGKFLYGSNRGHDSIAVFAVDSESGKLKLVEHQPTRGRNPRHFSIDPTGKFLLAGNQDSDNIVLFGIDQASGRLEFLREFKAPTPVCIKFL